MTKRETLIYILRHAWLWPLRFWMRPAAIAREAIDKDAVGVAITWSAVLGAFAWGLLGSAVLFLFMGNEHVIWTIPFACIIAIIMAFSASKLVPFMALLMAFAGIIPDDEVRKLIGARAITGIAVLAITGGVVIVGADIIVVAAVIVISFLAAAMGMGLGMITEIGPTFFGVNVITTAATAAVAMAIAIISSIGITIGLLLSPFWVWLWFGLFAAEFVSGIIFLLLPSRLKSKNFYKKIFKFLFPWTVLWLIGFLIFGFALFPSTLTPTAKSWGVVLSVAIGLNYSAGFFCLRINAFTYRNLRHSESQSRTFLFGIWLFCSLLAIVAWLPEPESYNLDAKLDTLAFFLFCTPLVVTALPLYPLLALVAWYQSRLVSMSRVGDTNRLLPLRFHSFAYPLPGLFDLLRYYAGRQGMTETVRLLQRLQNESLQEATLARAARRLASTPEWGLPFCGEVAIFTDAVTTVPLALSGEGGKAVAVLVAWMEKEDEKWLKLYFGEYPPRPSLFFRMIQTFVPDSSNPNHPIEQFQTIRTQPLHQRLVSAKIYLAGCDGYAQVEEFRALLTVLAACAEVKDVQSLESLNLIPAEIPPSAWLTQGWAMLAPFRDLAAALPEYRRYADAQTRRDFLQRLSEQLKSERWEELSEYWRHIAQELARHWVDLLRAEAQQAREWLRIAVDLPPQQLRVGQHNLALRVRNLSGAAARRLHLHIREADPGLHCAAAELDFPTPLEPRQEIRIHLPFSCTRAGSYLLRGEVIAEDLDGHSAQDAFAERLDIGQAGRAYRKQEIAPYVAGEGLGDDRTFVERGELRHRLQALWRQPGGKPAVLLTGLRRIGKSSLLNKIEREGLEDCQLWPLRLDLQGCNTPLGLWQDLAREMAKRLDIPPPRLGETDPFADFKAFLLDQGGRLRPWRFLLLLDEAERLWKAIDGQAPDNLRHLMQGHEYPLLVLFCGTQALKREAARYDSALFNTCHSFELGYMSEAESREVLERPARDILEYDPAALEDAYRLTRGQPFLLQLLGSVIIERFDAAVIAGQERSDYVGLRDLQDTADDLVRRGNPAFEQYWQDADGDTRKLFSALAWATDELSRPQLDMVGIWQALRETRLVGIEAVSTQPGRADLRFAQPLFNQQTLFERLEDLSQEGLLHNAGPTYRFAVPLFRRWIAHRWPPDKLRMGG